VVSNRPGIVCAGLAVMDQIYSVERLPEAPRKHFATAFREVGGGPAASAAVAVARLGGEARLWSRVGDDSIGERILDELRQEGVAVTGVRRIPGARSGCSAIVVDARGERMIVNFRGDHMDPDPAWLPLSEIRGAGAVLGDLRWPEGSARALAEARRLGIPALLDADAASPREGDEAFAVASHILFSSQGLVEFTGIGEPEEALRLAASRTEVVDTLGAGDVLHGAFALSLARGELIEDALRFACAAAALKCAKPGGRAGAPRAEEVERFLEERAQLDPGRKRR
jgi:sulfofructose kinase